MVDMHSGHSVVRFKGPDEATVKKVFTNHLDVQLTTLKNLFQFYTQVTHVAFENFLAHEKWYQRFGKIQGACLAAKIFDRRRNGQAQARL